MPEENQGLFKNLFYFILKRKKIFFIFLIFIIVLVYAVFGKKGLLQRANLEIESRELDKKLTQEKEKTIMLQNEIEQIKTSDKKIEQIAREKYGMVKEGEEMYKIIIDSTK